MSSKQCLGKCKDGYQCERNAKIGIDYCWQHKVLDNQEIPSLNNISTDILKYVLNPYLTYNEDIVNLNLINKEFSKIKFDIKPHIRIEDKEYPNGRYFRIRKTFLDNILIKQEDWNRDGIKKYQWELNLENEHSITQYGYDNGNLKSVEHRDATNRLDGQMLAYYENGNLKTDRYFKNDELDGKSIDFYENGQIEKEENYKDGLKNGKQIEYYSNGNKRYEYNYKNDKQNEIQLGWYEDGTKMQEINFKNGIQLSGTGWYIDGRTYNI